MKGYVALGLLAGTAAGSLFVAANPQPLMAGTTTEHTSTVPLLAVQFFATASLFSGSFLACWWLYSAFWRMGEEGQKTVLFVGVETFLLMLFLQSLSWIYLSPCTGHPGYCYDYSLPIDLLRVPGWILALATAVVVPPLFALATR